MSRVDVPADAEAGHPLGYEVVRKRRIDGIHRRHSSRHCDFQSSRSTPINHNPLRTALDVGPLAKMLGLNLKPAMGCKPHLLERLVVPLRHPLRIAASDVVLDVEDEETS